MIVDEAISEEHPFVRYEPPPVERTDEVLREVQKEEHQVRFG